MVRSLARAVSEYAVDWQSVPWPIRWDEVFGRAAPLVLEIGFGNGAFLAEQARAHPERDHVGLELSWTAATHLFRRLRASRLANVRVMIGDAEALVRETFPPQSLAEVIVNHPCPWPKSRHHQRRLLARAFLVRLAERMRPLARLTVVTDHAEYAQWLSAELAAQRALVSCHATSSVAALAGRTPTKYQLKAMAQGLPIHYFEWQKPASAAGAALAAETPRAISMPTLTLSGALAGEELFQGFRPLRFRERIEERDAAGTTELEVIVKFEAVYRRDLPASDAPVWMLETVVQEGPLRQRFAVDVVRLDAGARGASVLLKPSAIGQPYPTHGVKRAVWCVARWLQSRHPALTVENESLGLAAPPEPWPPPE